MAETLPRDILENIFSRLPIDSILLCKRVCNTWRRVIGINVGFLFTFKRIRVTTPPPWIDMNYSTQIFYGDPENENKIEKYYSDKTLTQLPLQGHESIFDGMVGSCNGLVLFYVKRSVYPEEYLSFRCRNPITGETARIPGLKTLGRTRVTPFGGFGYVGSTNEYKVIRIYFDWLRICQYIQVYTLGSHLGWREIEEKVPHHCFSSSEVSGVFANGAVHWINSRESQKCEILVFGLANEEFWPIPSPPYTNSFGENIRSKLTLLGGNLCAVHSNYQSINKRLDIWAFKKTNNGNSQGEKKEKQPEYCYDDTWSWSKEYSIAWEGEVMYTPFVITKRNTVLLWENGTSNLRCFDPKTSTLEKYWDGGERDSGYVQAIPHMNSLVSLKELGEI